MKFDINDTWDSVKDGIKDVAEVAHEKTSAFHENYVSKVIPDFGKYGNVAKFTAEMIPGVSEYNAIKDGDWTAFAIAAGVDIAAIGIGAFTAGAGYAAVKGGRTAAKAGVRVAAKEIAEAGTETIVKETIEASVKTVVKETAETGAEKIIKETVEAGVEVAAKETLEYGSKIAVREFAETGAEKVAKETVEKGTKKIAKEVAEINSEKMIKETTKTAAKEVVEESTEKTAKEIVEKGAMATDRKIYRYIECRNQSLEGTSHPITGIEFARKRVDNGSAEIIEGVFPKFDSAFDTKLPKELYKESNFKQFKRANSDLIEKIDSTPELRNKFSLEQIEQIREGVTTGAAPDGYIWHHNEEMGVLQLVDEAIHSKTGHTGGRDIWGGGY